ncbi:hypothetical protein DPMN_053670 [Dreissena polymorpha]|uniref:Uncharacterized protein n=1 Tax=Dreissena polymorpha TaxID=45954 RepID=A0A9D4CMJ4_DREPO|nr:hypothetical protein DPMN_053670 [Dreissena polymorpha]
MWAGRPRDKRPKVDVSSYMFDGLKGETVGKLPGSLNGTQFIIQNCEFREAGLSVFNNNWSNIHDFTQDATETHYTLLPEDSKVEDFVPLPTGEMFEPMHIDLNLDKSVVPRSMGNRRKTSDESCLVVFFYGGNSQERALSFIDGMRQTHPECVLVQTKELKMQSNDAQRVFGTDLYKEAVSRGR